MLSQLKKLIIEYVDKITGKKELQDQYNSLLVEHEKALDIAKLERKSSMNIQNEYDSLLIECKNTLNTLNTLKLQKDSLESQKMTLVNERENIFYKPGHFYSPIPDFKDIFENQLQIFDKTQKIVHGIDLKIDNQINFLKQLSHYSQDFPFPKVKNSKYHYYSQNSTFNYNDALTLFCIIRILNPNCIIEVGSGFSSAIILDTNKFYLNNSVITHFIEPYPELFNEIFSEEERKSIDIIEKKLQDINLEFFQALSDGDILFIDSSHVCKLGSDVNYFFSNILPNLNSGVIIHIHDIFFPFEYPINWARERRAWNEAYILRAFLQFNQDFEIILWPDFLIQFHTDEWLDCMPNKLEDGSSSIWLKRK